MWRVAQYSGVKVRAVHPPGTVRDGRPQTFDWRARGGSPDNTWHVKPAGRIYTLRDALAETYETEAMFGAALLVDRHGAPIDSASTRLDRRGRPDIRQPRPSKDALPWLATQGISVAFELFILEGDLRDAQGRKTHWTAALLDAFEQTCAGIPLLDRAVRWFSEHGWRLTILYARPVTCPTQQENIIHGTLLHVRKRGLDADDACKDWTRQMGAARIRKTHKETGEGYRINERFDADVAVELASGIDPLDLPTVARSRGHAGWTGAGAKPKKPTPKRAAGATATPAGYAPDPDSDPDADDAVEPLVFLATLPPTWRSRAERLAEAALATAEEWHGMFLALAGALCERGVELEILPALLGAVSALTGNDARDRTTDAVTTAERWQQRLRRGDGPPVAGYDALARDFPAMAAALDEVTPARDVAERLRRRCNRPKRRLPPAAEVAPAIERAIAAAPRGASVIECSPGTGKTKAAIRVAVRAASAQYAPQSNEQSSEQPSAQPRPPAGARRAPPGSKTALAFKTNEKALEEFDAATRAGVPVRRIFSPLSVLGPDGAPVCVHHVAARALVEGGQSVRREFCDGRGIAPCALRGACPAYAGSAGPADARILLGNHAELADLAAHAGATGRLLIDESPELLASPAFSQTELATAMQYRSCFGARFTDACAPLLRAVRALLEDADDGGDARADLPGVLPRATARAVPVLDAVRDHAAAVAPAALAAACRATRTLALPDDDAALTTLRAAAAAPEDGAGPAPPLHAREALRARDAGQREFAAALGVASKVWLTLHRAALASVGGGATHVVRTERGADGVRRVVFTAPNAALVDALRRDGVTAILDATADVAVLSRLAGVDLEAAGRVTRLHAAERATVERALAVWRDGARAALFTRDGLRPASLRTGLRHLVRWARERPETLSLGIVTFKRVAQVLGAALRPGAVAGARAQWVKDGLSGKNFDACLAVARFALLPWLDGDGHPTGARRTIELGHYGAIRGLNRMQTVQCLATLGDPWPSLADAREGAFYLGLGARWEPRFEAAACAELEQAQGRLRTIWREESLRALHVGALLPSGPEWEGQVRFRDTETHRPRTDAAMTPEEIRGEVVRLGLSVRRAARAWEISVAALHRYLRNDRAIPQDVASKVRGGTEHLAGIRKGYSEDVRIALSDTAQTFSDPGGEADWCLGVSQDPSPPCEPEERDDPRHATAPDTPEVSPGAPSGHRKRPADTAPHPDG